MTWVLVALIGLVGGVVSGLFGVGGAIVIVPALMLLVKLPPHTASGTSLASLLLPVGLLGAMEYYRRGQVNIPYAIILAAGLFARVRIPVGSKYKALLLPPEAVGSDLSQQFVFVVDDQNLVQYRKVTLGPIIDGLRVVRDGVQPEDWVIVKGVQRAKTGAKVDPIKQAIPDAQPALPPTPERTAQKPHGGR